MVWYYDGGIYDGMKWDIWGIRDGDGDGME